KTGGTGSFRWIYNGSPHSYDEGNDTYSMFFDFTGPPLFAQTRWQQGVTDRPVKFDARYTSCEWDPTWDCTKTWDAPGQPPGSRPLSAGKYNYGSEFWVQWRFAVDNRFTMRYPIGQTGAGVVAITNMTRVANGDGTWTVTVTAPGVQATGGANLRIFRTVIIN